METTKKRTVITVNTTVNAPMEKVWKYFNFPEFITKWYYASDDWHAPMSKGDFKEGGKMTTRMEAKDKSMGFDFTVTFTKIKNNELVEYVMEDGRKVNIKFEQDGKGVKIVEAFEAEDQNPEEMQRAGWQAILDNFKKYAEQN